MKVLATDCVTLETSVASSDVERRGRAGDCGCLERGRWTDRGCVLGAVVRVVLAGGKVFLVIAVTVAVGGQWMFWRVHRLWSAGRGCVVWP